MKKETQSDLKGAKNIGITIEKRLNEIGVFTLADLAKMTPVKAYKKIFQQNPDKIIPICYYLYALEGALLDTHWNELPQDIKAALKKAVKPV